MALHTAYSTQHEESRPPSNHEYLGLYTWWKEYCGELYDDQETTACTTEEREPPPLRSEIVRALPKTANGKAPGPDDEPVELPKKGEAAIDELHAILTEIWESGEWPDDWTQSVFIPIPKKGNLCDRENYRTIALVSHTSKILLRVILNRIQAKAETDCRGTSQLQTRKRNERSDHEHQNHNGEGKVASTTALHLFSLISRKRLIQLAIKSCGGHLLIWDFLPISFSCFQTSIRIRKLLYNWGVAYQNGLGFVKV